MSQPRLIDIAWEGPFTLDGARSHSRATSQGIYQIYGQHLVFGLGSLLYIGATAEQSFTTRLTQHLERWLKDEQDVSVYLGFPVGVLSPKDLLEVRRAPTP